MTPTIGGGSSVSDRTSNRGSAWDEDDEETDNDYGVDSAHVDDREEVETLLVTVKNPAASVSTTVVMNGQVLTVDLSPAVTAWSEAHLAEEIVVLATLARKQALAAQHSFTAAIMQQLGHDPVATRGLLEREIGLPSPSAVLAEKARIFATRYQDDD